MPFSDQLIDILIPADRADLEAATYFILEACCDYGDSVGLAFVEDASYFAIHAVMADRPDQRMMLVADSLAEALDQLELVRIARPDAGLWFSSMEVLAKIEHPNLARGVVLARGSADPDDDEDDWSIMAAHIAECEASGQPLDMSVNASDVISTIADRLV
jgi:hypothetical protein